MTVGVMLAGPHLMLTHAGGDNGVVLSHVAQKLHHILLLNDVLGVLETKRILLPPRVDLAIPLGVSLE